MEQDTLALKTVNGKRKHLLGIILLVGLFLPHIATPLLLVNPLMCLYLFFTEKRVQLPRSIKLLRIIFSAIIVLSTVISINYGTHDSNKYILMGANMLLVMVCFPFMGGEIIPKVYYYIALSFIILSQIVYLIGFEPLQVFFELLYPVKGENDTRIFNYMKEHITFGGIFDYRLGGLFHNPNQASRYITSLVALFLVDHSKERFVSVMRFMFFAFISVLLTGSRTGFVVLFVLGGYYLYKSETISKQVRAGMYILLLFLFLPVAMIAASETIRGLNVAGGMSDSFAFKIQVFADYLGQPNSFLHLLIGYADPDSFRPSDVSVIEIFDSEYGNMVYTYGFLGLIINIAFYLSCWRYTIRRGRIFYFMLLWYITSTLLFSYRMCFIFMFMLSHIVSLDRKE